MSKKIILALTLTSLFTLTTISFAQTLTPLVHQSPGGANLAFQLTDGTVMCQANSSQNWYKLTPDNTGSYVNGTWTQVASLQPGYVPMISHRRSWLTAESSSRAANITTASLPLQIWAQSMTRSQIPGLRWQLRLVGISSVILLRWFYRMAGS